MEVVVAALCFQGVDEHALDGLDLFDGSFRRPGQCDDQRVLRRAGDAS